MGFLQTLGLTDFDIAVILLTLLSIIIGFIRGFSREVLSITSWVGSLLMALHLRPLALPLVKAYITSTFFAEPIAIFIVFFLCFALLAKLSKIIAKTVKSSVVGIIDRLLGVGFGLLRASILLGAAYMGYSSVSAPSAPQAEFLTHSKTLPVIKTSVTLLHILLPQDLVNASQKAFEVWVDDQLKTPGKSSQVPESWPEVESQNRPPHSHEAPQMPPPEETPKSPQHIKNVPSAIGAPEPTKSLVENLSKINISPQDAKTTITSGQQKTLDRMLEAY